MQTFNAVRSEWLNRQTCKDTAAKYGLISDQETCMEESFNEEIRQSIEENYEPDDFYENIIRKRNEEIIGKEKDLSRNFWKRQLSRTFFEGNAPPCPSPTPSSMQRKDVRFCFECHASNTFEDWIEGHARAMKIMPSMMTGDHISNCVHSAYNVVKKNIRAHREYSDSIDVEKFIQYKQGKPPNHGYQGRE